MRSILIHSLVFLLFSMGPLLLWQLRNYAITGYSGFSAISEVNLYFYNAAAVTAIKEGRPYIDQQIKLGIWDMGQYVANHPEQQEWSDAQRFDYMKNSAVKIIKNDPLLYFNIHIKGILRVLFDPGMIKYFKMFQYQSDKIQFLGDFVDYGLIRNIIYFFKVKPLIFYTYLFFGVILFLCIYFSAVAIFLGKIKYSYHHIVLFIIIIYFLILSGGPGDSPRFRLPIMPLISIFAGYGMIISLEGCRYCRGLSRKKLF